MKVALAGNPNSGKSTLFNAFTGLKQKTANYPGVTVELLEATFTVGRTSYTLIDLPGIYHLYAASQDERVAVERLLLKEPVDAVCFVIDLTSLRSSLTLLQQIADLGIPMVLLLNKSDQVPQAEHEIYRSQIQSFTGLSCYLTHSGETFTKDRFNMLMAEARVCKAFAYRVPASFFSELLQSEPHSIDHPYREFILAANNSYKQYTGYIKNELSYRKTATDKLFSNLKEKVSQRKAAVFTQKLDKIVLHPVWGTLTLLIIFFVFFQSIFYLAEWPMTWIEEGMSWFSGFLKERLPGNFLSSFLTDGLLLGITGVIVFLPQIIILFLMMGILEESGYFSRIQYLSDKMLNRFGLEGRSVIPLISGAACAIPAIMATRTIQDKGKRLRTMLVIPLITCSARLPVFVLLIALLPLPAAVWGISYKTIFLLSIYALGAIFAVMVAFVLSKVTPKTSSGLRIIQVPDYRLPSMRSILIESLVKARSFVKQAGLVILIITLLLWLLSCVQVTGQGLSFGTPQALSTSVIGKLGQWLEPVVRPLGFDWKIGIAILCSFAAREVFVATILTIYGLEAGLADNATLVQTLQVQTWDNGAPVYTVAAVASLMVFYFFALQCVSTLAIMRKETNGWKWPLATWLLYAAMAYLGSWLTYEAFSVF